MTITSAPLPRKPGHFPLKKPAGFHWDFFLLGCTCFIAGIIGIPLPNGLVTQAPVHTDALTDYNDHVKEIETRDGAVLIRKETTADSVVEQRISHFMIGLAIIGTMTGPLLVVLQTMPRAIFAGVFFIVGWGSIRSNGIVEKIRFLIREPRYRQPHNPLLTISQRQIWYYLIWQLLGWAATVAISQTISHRVFRSDRFVDPVEVGNLAKVVPRERVESHGWVDGNDRGRSCKFGRQAGHAGGGEGEAEADSGRSRCRGER